MVNNVAPFPLGSGVFLCSPQSLISHISYLISPKKVCPFLYHTPPATLQKKSMCGLQGIDTLCDSATYPGGLIRVEYLPVAYVNRPLSAFLYDHQQTWTGLITYAGAWLTLTGKQNDRLFSDSQVNTEQGVHYNREVTINKKGITPAVIAELEKMKQFRYLVRVTDRKRNRYMLNDWSTGFEVTTDMNTGNAATNTPNLRITFRGLVPTQSFNNPIN